MADTVDIPKTLNPDGSVPSSRMNNAQSTAARVYKLMDNDNQGRSRRRTLVKGLVDGNAPYSAKLLRNSGRADACNVNWRQAEALLSKAASAFYDVFSEAETHATIQLDLEDPGLQESNSKIVTQEFDRMLKEDEGFENTIQVSIEGTVLHGRGPMTFPSKVDWRPKCVQDRDCLVPDRAPSNVSEWQELCVLSEMTPDQLYSKIRDPEIGSMAGWNVEAVKQSIIHACTSAEDTNEQRAWEYYQERLKTQSQLYSDDSRVIKLAHYYVREFPTEENPEGMISHTVVLQPQSESAGEANSQFLFKKVGEFESWAEVIHPMYYDALGGGKHYAVTGLGQKMYSALEFQNRMLCTLGDKAFMPDTMVEPGSESDSDGLKILKMGPYGIWPKGAKAVQSGIRGSLQEGTQLFQMVGGILDSNLAGYRSSTPQKAGNPVTAEEFKIRASEQSQLGGTQLSRYLFQLSRLYTQMYKRAVNVPDKSAPGGRAAMAFIERCKKRGVSRDELKKIKCVEATPTVGKGSQVQRQQALANLTPFISLLPAAGQINFMRDTFAAHTGVRMVDRYMPRNMIPEQSDEHTVTATLQVAGMKQGVPAVVIKDQNHEVFATVFIEAGAEALASVQQGGKPAEVLAFLELAMPAAAQHIELLGKDSTKKQAAERLSEQFREIAKMADQLREFAGQTPEQQQEAQDLSFDQKLAMQKVQGEQELAKFKVTEANKRSNQKMKQQMASKDAQTAAGITLNARKTEADIRLAAAKPTNGAG